MVEHSSAVISDCRKYRDHTVSASEWAKHRDLCDKARELHLQIKRMKLGPI